VVEVEAERGGVSKEIEVEEEEEAEEGGKRVVEEEEEGRVREMM
jgi:hypothetical protein